MFGKCLKYNLKEIGRVLLPIYGAMLVLALVLGLTAHFSIMSGARQLITSTVPGVVILILFLVLGTLTFAMGIITLVMIERNFRVNLFGSRGYLENVLPVKPEEHVFSKLLGGLIWMALGSGVAFASGMIIMYLALSKGEWAEFTGSLIDSFGSGSQIRGFTLQLVLLAFFWAVEFISKIYVSVSAGNLWKSKRTLGAVLAFAAITGIQILIGSLLSHISADSSISYALAGRGMSLVFGFDNDQASLLTPVQLAIQLAEQGIYAAIFLALTIRTLKGRLDLQ